MKIRILTSSISILALKIFGAGSVFALSFLLEKKEYAKFGIYYAVLTGVAAMTQSGLFELGALIKDTGEAPGDSNLKYLRMIVIKLFTKFAAVLFLVGLILTILNSNYVLLSSIAFSMSVGIVVASGNVLSSLFRLTDDKRLAIIVLTLFGGLSSLGYVGGALLYKTAQSSITCAAISSMFAMLVCYFWNLSKHGSFPKVKIFDKNNSKILIDYIVISLTGWVAGYGMNLFVYGMLSADLVAEYFLIYSVTAAMGMITFSINSTWSPKFIYESKNNNKNAEKNNSNIFLIELIIITVLSILALIMAKLSSHYIRSNTIITLATNTHFLALALASILISIPWWSIQNFFTRDGLSLHYRKIVISTSCVGFTLWIVLIYFLGSDGLYIGLFFNSAVKTLLFKQLSKSFYSSSGLLMESIVASFIVIAAGYYMKFS